MACKTSFELHHHFPKLAEESGFTFNTHRPRIHIDWNKIRLIDIDSLIKERKFVIIEQHLNDILDCVFESEFDIRILDEGVMKMFRLAQLAVEYQQFCRHYLDRSVYVLREEITSLAQELDTCKKDLRDKDEEIRRLRKRSRHSFKTPLPYSNDNIATMILKTLSHKGDVMFQSASNESLMQYNKCNYCDKVFLNQLYLKSHISRRHGHVVEPPQKDKLENNKNNENAKLSDEVTELKNKINEMELVIANTNKQISNHKKPNETKTSNIVVNEEKHDKINSQNNKKDMKDAEVSTYSEDYLLNKLEEWKKEEHEKYNKEMNKLRNQIMEMINSIKEKDTEKLSQSESNIILQLHETIKQQGAEIIALKKELIDSKHRTEKENADRSKEAEAQVSFWTNRAEAQSKQYELLLQKLNDVARDAKESRALAEAERERAAQLKVLLQQTLNCRTNDVVESTDDVLTPAKTSDKKPNNLAVRKKKIKLQPNCNKAEQEPDSNSLEKLHRKAQELLNIASITSSSSDTSTAENVKPFKTNNIITNERPTRVVENVKVIGDITNKPKKVEDHTQKIQNSIYTATVQNSIGKATKLLNGKGPKLKKEKIKNNLVKSPKARSRPGVIPGSPMKLVRAKVTEEVNSRLVSAGVDPLKSRLPQSVFHKQRMQLQQQQELKAKKNPAHDKVRHTILAFLDSNTTDFKKEVTQVPDYISPTKVNKPFKNLTSVISNVKTKALSLVKLNDSNVKEKQKSQHAEVAKRAMSLLKTPPGSASSSPIITKRSPLRAFITQKSRNATDENTKTNQETNITPKKIVKGPDLRKTLQISMPTSNSEEVSEESDHKYYNTTTVQQSSKSIENLIKSPARRPASAAADYNHTVQKYTISDDNLLRTQSVSNLVESATISNEIIKNHSSKLSPTKTVDNSSDDVESLSDVPIKKNFLDENVQNTVKQTKSVLKNASSTSSLNKKKVLFDMDAIQMKSVSASPSQSLTEKSDGHEKYELGLVNLDGEEWDISSIDNEPLKNDTKIQNVTRTSPKIAELKEKIESQLARRNDTPTTGLVGRVDVLAGTMIKAGSIGGSNTSLGSSILDDSESAPIVNHKTIVKPKRVTAKDDSDIDISEFSIDGIGNKNESF